MPPLPPLEKSLHESYTFISMRCHTKLPCGGYSHERLIKYNYRGIYYNELYAYYNIAKSIFVHTFYPQLPRNVNGTHVRNYVVFA